MPEVAVCAVTLSGDAGGAGISRFHVKHKDGSAIDSAACNAAMAALRAFYNTPTTFLPSVMSWSFVTPVMVIDEASAELARYMSVGTPPTLVSGSGSGSYAAGNGLRVNWKTSTVRNRRLMRATTYMVPLANNAYTGQGQVSSGPMSSVLGACATLLAALDTANLALVAYHRPDKGMTSGGASAPISAYTIPATIAGLRSRRA
jgi:3-oxoacyl-(acyl-carrier-protein) synthase